MRPPIPTQGTDPPIPCSAPLLGVGGAPGRHGQREGEAAQPRLGQEEQGDRGVAPVGLPPLLRQRAQPPHLLLHKVCWAQVRVLR